MPILNQEGLQDSGEYGGLRFKITAADGFIPVKGAKITVSLSSQSEVTMGEVISDESGLTQVLDLPAPPLSYSEQPSAEQPYTDYTARVNAEGYEPFFVEGMEILPKTVSLQEIRLNLVGSEQTVPDQVIIPEHTLYGTYPEKIPEEEIKPMTETGEIVLSRVVIPEYIVVHDGAPNDANAKNYYVRYTDYIKNVVSSEIYATWPEATIYANILCIMSFTLNRVYTEWYRSKGYNFTITSSTAYDQKWIYGRNTYDKIDSLVDNLFNNYLSRPGIKQPIFTSYCDGNRTNCRGLKQWGSKNLGDQGYSAIEIIRYYYGSDMYINSADAIAGIPSSYPGYDLRVGSSGAKVRQMQQQLNRIARNYPAIPTVTVDGTFGNQTAQAVKAFQKIFGYPQNGIVDYPVWYGISSVFVGVSRIAELS